jgi:MoaA/NifB/PqqE/SkfB family radical SAM enzyme
MINSNYCKHPWYDVWVNADGRVTCCTQNRTTYGNLNTESFDEVWNSDNAKKVRSSVRQGKYTEAGCDPECPFLRGNPETPSISPPDEELINPKFDPPNTKEESLYSINYYKAEDSYKKGLLELENYPLFVDIQNLLLCNFDCFMCGQPHKDGLKHSKLLTNKLELLKPYANFFRWQGGEVFLIDDFADYLEDFLDPKYSNLRRYVITNGSKLNESIIDSLTRLKNPVHFLISIDGATEETFYKVRKRKVFNNSMKVLKYLSHVQKELNSTDIVRWNYVVMKSTLSEMKMAIDIAHNLGIDINFAPIQGPYSDENIFKYSDLISRDLLIEQLEELEEYAKQLTINVSGFLGMHVRLKNSKSEDSLIPLLN